MLEGATLVNLPADSHIEAATVRLEAPTTSEPRHYTLYLTLTAADGKVLSENWDHFMVVPNARKFRPAEGITPAPRFKLELRLSREGAPLREAEIVIQDKYTPDRHYSARLDGEGRAALTDLIPGAYRLEVLGPELRVPAQSGRNPGSGFPARAEDDARRQADHRVERRAAAPLT